MRKVIALHLRKNEDEVLPIYLLDVVLLLAEDDGLGSDYLELDLARHDAPVNCRHLYKKVC